MQTEADALASADAAADAARSTAERARAAAERCARSFRLGALAQAQQEALAALPLLRGPAFETERHETLRLLTMAASEIGAFDTAFEAARSLVRESAERRDAGLALLAAFALACCFERMGDSWQAVRVISESLARDGDAAPPNMRLRSLNCVCAVLLGNWHRSRGVIPPAESDELLLRARAHGEQALALLEGSPAGTHEAAYEVAVRGNLAEVLLHQGEPATSAVLLARAMAVAEREGLRAYGWRLVTTHADSLLDAGDAEAALARVEGLLQAMGEQAPMATAVRAHHTAWRANRALGRFEAALMQFEACERLERQRAVSQLRAQSELFVTRSEVEHAQWQAEHARQEAQRQSARAAEYKQRAEHDALTGLGNRRQFERRMAELLPRLAAERAPLALAELDIDHFKRINDARGHDVGDAVLVALAQLLRESMRSDDVLVRMGGEEFVLVLPRMPATLATEVCERLRQRVAAHAWPGLGELQVTVSIGLATAVPQAGRLDGAALLKCADDALYRAKAAGRNRVEAIAA